MRHPLALGGSYASQSPLASADQTMNWYTELMESGAGKSQLVLYPTPGLAVFADLLGSSVRGNFATNGRSFAVSGDTLWELSSDGTKTNRGTVIDDAQPVSMAANQIQLLVASGGTAYILTLATNVLTTVAAATLTDVAKVVYIDSFFIALIKDSQTFRISKVLDGETWPADQFIAVSVFPDDVLSIIVDHRELWVLGRTRSVVYYVSGSPAILDVNPQSIMEEGIVAGDSAANLDNSILWLAGDERGQAMVKRAAGYTPQRVSNHAIEFAMQGYSTVSDARAYSYQDQGHAFYVLYFPAAGATWVYDVATNMWHERSFLRLGSPEAHHSQNHSFVFGKHLVGDWSSGNLYEMSIDLLDDAGSEIKRIRRVPHISEESKWYFHHQLQVDVETGLGPTPPLVDGNGNPRDPKMMLRWSDDGGHTWSNEHQRDAGKVGEYKKRVRWQRLGRSRDRVYEVSASDRIPWRVIDGYLDLSPGNGA